MNRLPAPVLDVDKALDTVSTMVETVRDRLTAEASRTWLELQALKALLDGSLELLPIIEAAENGDVIADRVLRRAYYEMRDNGLEPPKTLESYCLRALVREPVRREKGRVWYDGWLRNIGISVLVAATKLQFGLNPTRNREARRRQQPSACSLVATALGRHSINIEEKRVENLWAQYQGFVLSYLVGRFGV